MIGKLCLGHFCSRHLQLKPVLGNLESPETVCIEPLEKTIILCLSGVGISAPSSSFLNFLRWNSPACFNNRPVFVLDNTCGGWASCWLVSMLHPINKPREWTFLPYGGFSWYVVLKKSATCCLKWWLVLTSLYVFCECFINRDVAPSTPHPHPTHTHVRTHIHHKMKWACILLCARWDRSKIHFWSQRVWLIIIDTLVFPVGQK